MERDFKGVWIPKEVWLDERLSALDKIILIEIDSLDNGENGCFASNKYLAEFCQCSESKVSKTVSRLIELGYLEQKSFNGRQRVLQSCLVKSTRQDSKKYEADSQKVRPSNIYNNKTNNKKVILDKSKITKKSETSKSSSRKTKKEKYLEKILGRLEEYDFSDNVKNEILAFYEDRLSKGDYPGENQLTRTLNELASTNESNQLKALNLSIKNGYKGIFVKQEEYDGIHFNNKSITEKEKDKKDWDETLENGVEGKDYYTF